MLDVPSVRRRRNCENARKARARKKMEIAQLQVQAIQLKEAKARAKEEAKVAKDVQARVVSLIGILTAGKKRAGERVQSRDYNTPDSALGSTQVVGQ